MGNVFIYVDFSWFSQAIWFVTIFLSLSRNGGQLGVGSISQKNSRIVTPNDGLVREVSPKCPKHSGLGIVVICPAYPLVEFPECVTQWVDYFEIHPRNIWECYSKNNRELFWCLETCSVFVLASSSSHAFLRSGILLKFAVQLRIQQNDINRRGTFTMKGAVLSGCTHW